MAVLGFKPRHFDSSVQATDQHCTASPGKKCALGLTGPQPQFPNKRFNITQRSL